MCFKVKFPSKLKCVTTKIKKENIYINLRQESKLKWKMCTALVGQKYSAKFDADAPSEMSLPWLKGSGREFRFTLGTPWPASSRKV